MALDIAAYKNSLKAAAMSKQTAFSALAANDPKKLARIGELTAKWQGLKDQEVEIGTKLAQDAAFKADNLLLTEIDKLKTSVSAELVALGEVKPT